MATTALTEQEIQQKLEEVIEWNYNKKSIYKKFNFSKYLDSIDFVQKVGLKAETIDHHPRIIVEYGFVTIEIHTHSINGISNLDFKLAKMIDSIFDKL